MKLLAALGTVLPVFALIFAGWLARRTKLFDAGVAAALSRYVVVLAMPALMFGIVARVDWRTILDPGLVASFAIAAFAIFFLVLGWSRLRGVPMEDAGVAALSAGFGNTGYLGIPLAVLAYGDLGLAVATMATIVTVIVMMVVAVVFIEVSRERGQHALRLAGRVGLSLLRNPFFLPPAVGAAWAATGWPLPQGVGSFVDLLAASASPCALVALGLFLAEPRRRPARGPLAGAVVLKLLVQPALTALLAWQVFGLEPRVAAACVLLAALPTGTGPFMLAEFYRRDPALPSRTVLVTTLGSLVTVTLLQAAFSGP